MPWAIWAWELASKPDVVVLHVVLLAHIRPARHYAYSLLALTPTSTRTHTALALAIS